MRKPLLLGFGSAQQIAFARRLSAFLSAGVPIVEALSLLREDARSGTYVLDTLITDVTEGRTLSSGFRRFPHALSSLSISLVEVGEQSGNLPDSLRHMAQTLERQQTLARKLMGALAYPAVIVSATLGISSFLVLYALPKIVPLFRGFGTELPFATRALIAIADFGAAYGLACIALATACGGTAIALLRRPRIRERFDRTLLALPLFGPLLRSYALAQASRTLNVLLDAGVSVVRALEFAGAASGNRAYAAALAASASAVLGGTPLASALREHPRCFPRAYVQMVGTGERTGSLPGTLGILEAQHEEEFAGASARLTALVEPALMIVMGCMVGFIALAIITPVYQITQDLHG